MKRKISEEKDKKYKSKFQNLGSSSTSDSTDSDFSNLNVTEYYTDRDKNQESEDTEQSEDISDLMSVHSSDTLSLFSDTNDESESKDDTEDTDDDIESEPVEFKSDEFVYDSDDSEQDDLIRRLVETNITKTNSKQKLNLNADD